MPVVLLHGGGQTRHAWRATAEALARAGFNAFAVDLRGHGDSDWAPEGIYRGADFVGDLAALVARFERKPILIGASLGGMLALVFAGTVRPDGAAGIALVDVAHRARAEGVDRILDFMAAGSAGFADLDEAARAVAAYLAHRKRPASSDGLRKNLRQRADGRWYWHWDPRLLQTLDVGEVRTGGILTAAARNIRIPVLVVRGHESDVVDEAIARDLLDLIPHAQFVDVAGAGHMVAGDDNDAFTSALLAFAQSLASRS